MTRRMHAPTLWALLVAAMLASAYLIVGQNRSTMSGSASQPPAGVFH